ncbi:hypothetical protein VPHK469_0092 [Vibrio phage K469]
MQTKSTEYLRRYLASQNMQLVALGATDNTAIVNVVGNGGVEEREINIDWREVLVWKMSVVDAPIVNNRFDEAILEAMVNDN